MYTFSIILNRACKFLVFLKFIQKHELCVRHETCMCLYEKNMYLKCKKIQWIRVVLVKQLNLC